MTSSVPQDGAAILALTAMSMTSLNAAAQPAQAAQHIPDVITTYMRTKPVLAQVASICTAALLVIGLTVAVGPMSSLVAGASAHDIGPGGVGVGVDYPKCQVWAEHFDASSRTYNLPEMALYAVASRETGCRNIIGDGGHGRGVLQRDDRSWTIPADFMSNMRKQTDAAASLLRANADRYKGDWISAYNAYNSGRSTTASTSGKNYGPDVENRRQWLVKNHGSGSGRPATVVAADLACPLPGRTFRDSYGDPRPGGRSHQGIDIAALDGTPIQALWSGTVTRISDPTGGLGLRLASSSRLGQTLYIGHLSGYLVPDGAAVTVGQQIAKVGNTGASKGPHAHIETWTMNGGNISSRPNPYALLQQACSGAPSAAAPAGPLPPSSLDLNADGRPDVVVAERRNGDWNAILNTGDQFKRAPLTLFAPGSDGAQLLVGNVAGDGRPERCSVQSATWACIDPDGRPLLLSAPSNDGGDTVMVADVTGPGGRPDGLEDRVAVHATTAVWATIDSTGRPGLLKAPGSPGAIMLAGDVDGDGLTDRLSVDRSREPVVWSGISGTGAPLSFRGPCGAHPSQHPLLFDVNGDRTEDRLCFDDRNGTYAGILSGSGTPWLLRSPAPDNSGPFVPAPADLDADGKDELSMYRAADHRWMTGAGSADGQPFSFDGPGGPGQQPMVVAGSRSGFDLAARQVLGLTLTPAGPAAAPPAQAPAPAMQAPAAAPVLQALQAPTAPQQPAPRQEPAQQPAPQQEPQRQPAPHNAPPRSEPPRQEPPRSEQPRPRSHPKPTITVQGCGADWQGEHPAPPPTKWWADGLVTSTADTNLRVTIRAALTYPDGHVSSSRTMTVVVPANGQIEWATGDVSIPPDDSHRHTKGGGCGTTVISFAAA